MMLSAVRKKVLSGWLKKNQPEEFASKLKLQKFLFFYEALSKVEGDRYDFSSLKGYINGPVFSDVYGDYQYRTFEFIAMVEEAYELSINAVNDDRAKLVGFLVKILTEEELSDLTHEFNIWKCQEEAIRAGTPHLRLDEYDFTPSDAALMRKLRDMYTLEYIESVDVHWVVNKCFIISKEESELLTDEHARTLINIVLEDAEEIISPAYLTLEDGVLMVD